MIDPIPAEQAVLACCITFPTGIDLARKLKPEDFSEEVHRALFSGMIKLADSGGHVSYQPLLAVLGLDDSRAIEGTGLSWGEYLRRLVVHAGPLVTLPDHIKIVKDLADARRVVATAQACMGILDVAGTGADIKAVASDLMIDLDTIITSRADDTAQRKTAAQTANAVMDAYEERRAGRKPRGVTTGIPSLDRALTGLHGGQLIILAGRPGMGKTSLAVTMAMAAARSGVGVLFFSLEMNDEELGNRAVSALTYSAHTGGVPYRNIIDPTGASDEEARRVYEAARDFKRYPIITEPEQGLMLSQIAARSRQARLYFEAKGIKLGLIVVDHLGLMRPSQNYRGNRVQEITEISGGLKGLAKDMGIPVLALCQLNRGVESREDKRPMLYDLRDSGSIEQDADVVMSVFREAYYLDKEKDEKPEAYVRWQAVKDQLEIEILKQRQGPTMRVTCFCDIGCNVISELSQ